MLILNFISAGVQYQHVQGHLVGLLQIIVATHVDLSIRQVASIYFKNVTARDWLPREPGKAAVTFFEIFHYH